MPKGDGLRPLDFVKSKTQFVTLDPSVGLASLRDRENWGREAGKPSLRDREPVRAPPHDHEKCPSEASRRTYKGLLGCFGWNDTPKGLIKLTRPYRGHS